eukprot:SAG31_NODE_4538_length_3155_cov_5.869437_4_plen_117_part_00
MRRMPRACARPAVMVAPFALLLALAAQAFAAPSLQTIGAGSAASAEHIARAAQHLRGDANVAAALQTIRVGESEADSDGEPTTGDITAGRRAGSRVLRIPDGARPAAACWRPQQPS